MANDTVITVIGNLTADPELRFTQSGAAVASFTVASTPRTFDRQSNEWKEGETLFMRCSIWRDAAENVAESLEKGMRVIVQGRLKQRSFTDREGNNRTAAEVVSDNVYFGESRRDSDNRASGDSGYTNASYSRSYEAPRAAAASNPSPFSELSEDEGELPF